MPEFIRGLKFLWKIKESDQAEVQKIAHANSLSFPVAQALYNRGYLNTDQAQNFLFSSFEKDVSHPSKFKGMQLAVARILCAIEKNEKIAKRLPLLEKEIEKLDIDLAIAKSQLPEEKEIPGLLNNVNITASCSTNSI